MSWQLRLGFLGPRTEVAWRWRAAGRIEGAEPTAWYSPDAGVDGPVRGPDPACSVADAAGLVERDDLDALVVCAPLGERPAWCDLARRPGRTVFCDEPMGRRCGEVKRVLAAAEDATGALLPLSMAEGSEPALLLDQVCRTPGAGRYLELHISVPRRWLGEREEGVILCAAVPYLGLLADRLGSVDSVWAHSRSVVRKCMNEDLAVAMVRFANGVEVSVHVEGLGGRDRVELRSYGRNGWRAAGHAPLASLAQDWQRACAGLLSQLARGLVPQSGTRHGLAGLELASWIQQSARLAQELNAREVERG